MSGADGEHIVSRVRDISRLHGWAIGAHGTMARDYDLIAVPWTDEASPMRAWLSALLLILNLRSIDGQEGVVLPGARAHGRLTFLLNHPDAEYMRPGPEHKGYWNPPTIDLSIIDPREREARSQAIAASSTVPLLSIAELCRVTDEKMNMRMTI